ncbi:MAG: pimeloyl-ACP methyl ester carboxylesterase [Candidatus Azotimanducaceae bacterium]
MVISRGYFVLSGWWRNLLTSPLQYWTYENCNTMIRLLTVSLLLIFGGSFLASSIQTDNGRVAVTDVRFEGDGGQMMSGLLYVPVNATAGSPQPGVLAVHGYINSRETQSGFAIELSRRGFVVLALDQTGHGYSDPPAFSQGFGGPAGLRYLRALPMVDNTRIGLEGHSMGGWAVLSAADSDPDGYSAMVLEGSSTGTFGTRTGTPDFPRNLLLVFSRFDEFSGFMWGSETSSDIVHTEKLKTLFGTEKEVVPNEIYGDPEQGDARKLNMPAVTHPGDHHSTVAIGMAISWLQQHLKPSLPLSVEDQRWYWKELGTALALLGIFMLIFPVADLLLKNRYFSDLSLSIPANGVSLNGGWAYAAILTAIIPILTFFPLQAWGGGVVLFGNQIWSQSITNGIVIWMLGTGFISFCSFVFWCKYQQSFVRSLSQCGLAGLGYVGKAFLLAALVFIELYLFAFLVDFLFLTDFRIWVVALKLMSTVQFHQFIVYLPLFTIYFVVLGIILHTQLRIEAHSIGRAIFVNGLLLTMGFVILLVVQYFPLLMGSSLAISSQPLLTIVAIQFVPLMMLIAAISTWSFFRTGAVYVGAFINALIVCWYVTAGQATQVVPFLF